MPTPSDSPELRTLTEEKMLKAEEAPTNPWTGKPRSERYFKLREQTEDLPAARPGVRANFLAIYHSSQVMVITGETGGGKSTKIAQHVLYDEHPVPRGDAGNGLDVGSIVITQPRRIAAKYLAQRVAAEQDVECGKELGYFFHGEKCCDPQRTIMSYCTDGSLTQRMISHPMLPGITTVIIDEAHERTLATDKLLGFLKLLLPKRLDLKIIITSATMNAAKFQHYFGGPDFVPLMRIPGSPFEVSCLYTPCALPDFINAAIRAVKEIHWSKKQGDILVFMPGEEEIHTCVRGIQHENLDIDVFELFSTLTIAEQQKALRPSITVGRRRCIFATNIAETSLTVPGIVYVVDTGVANVAFYNPRLRATRLQLVPISKAAARQRGGRSGRTQNGVCIRVYTKDMFNKLEDYPVPRIMLEHMGKTILEIMNNGQQDLWNFPFIDPPPTENMLRALEELIDLRCLENREGRPQPTHLGQQVLRLPLEPHQAVALARAPSFGCSIEIAMILSILSVESILPRPITRARSQEYVTDNICAVADKCHAAFKHPNGDHMMLFHIFQQFQHEHRRTCKEYYGSCRKTASEHPALRLWCDNQFLNCHELLNAVNFYNDLRKSMVDARVDVVELPNPCTHEASVAIRKALLEGHFTKMAFYDSEQCTYLTTENQSGLIHPSSPLSFDQATEYGLVMYDKFFLKGRRRYFLCASGIDIQWLFFSDNARSYVEDLIARDTMRKAPKGKPKAAPKLPIRQLMAAQADFQRTQS